jgi:hypothetical protein
VKETRTIESEESAREGGWKLFRRGEKFSRIVDVSKSTYDITCRKARINPVG